MNEQNQYLLDIIDLIQESTIDSELNVLASLRDFYNKTATYLEYCEDDTFMDTYFQEMFVMEADGNTEDKSTKKDSWFKAVLNGIKTAFLFLVKLIKKGLSKIKNFLYNKAGKRNDDLIYDYYENRENSKLAQYCKKKGYTIKVGDGGTDMGSLSIVDKNGTTIKIRSLSKGKKFNNDLHTDDHSFTHDNALALQIPWDLPELSVCLNHINNFFKSLESSKTIDQKKDAEIILMSKQLKRLYDNDKPEDRKEYSALEELDLIVTPLESLCTTISQYVNLSSKMNLTFKDTKFEDDFKEFKENIEKVVKEVGLTVSDVIGIITGVFNQRVVDDISMNKEEISDNNIMSALFNGGIEEIMTYNSYQNSNAGFHEVSITPSSHITSGLIEPDKAMDLSNPLNIFWNEGCFGSPIFGAVPGKAGQYFVTVMSIDTVLEVNQEELLKSHYPNNTRKVYQNYMFIMNDKQTLQSMTGFFMHTSKGLLNKLFNYVAIPYEYGKNADGYYSKEPNENNKSEILFIGYRFSKVLNRARKYGLKYKVNDNCIYFKANQIEQCLTELKKRFNVKNVKELEDGFYEVSLN